MKKRERERRYGPRKTEEEGIRKDIVSREREQA
jgi:hypothetical protein